VCHHHSLSSSWVLLLVVSIRVGEQQGICTRIETAGPSPPSHVNPFPASSSSCCAILTYSCHCGHWCWQSSM
jgi:hypothetical protein